MGSDNNMHIKRIAAAVAAAAFLLGLSSCGNDGTDISAETTVSETTASVSQTEASTAVSEVRDEVYGYLIMPRHETQLKDYVLDLANEASGYSEFCETEFADNESLDFFTQSQKELYARSLILTFDSCSDIGLRYTGEYEQYIEENSYLFHTGITYDSFYSYLTSIFTEEAANAFSYTFRNEDGELCFFLGGTGTDITYSGGSYSLVGINSERIDFIYTAEYSLENVVDKAEWEAGLYPDLTEWEWKVQTSIAIVNTPNGWRMEHYPTWY